MPNILVNLYLKYCSLLQRLRSFFWELDLRLRGVKVGKRLVLLGAVRVRGGKNITIGDDVRIYDNVYLSTFGTGKLTIGNRCSINRMTVINATESVTLTDNFHIGPMCFITDRDHVTPSEVSGPGISSPVLLEGPGGVSQGCTVLKGVHLGPYVTVAAGAVVTRSFPPGLIIAGVPAKELKKRPDYGKMVTARGPSSDEQQ